MVLLGEVFSRDTLTRTFRQSMDASHLNNLLTLTSGRATTACFSLMFGAAGANRYLREPLGQTSEALRPPAHVAKPRKCDS